MMKLLALLALWFLFGCQPIPSPSPPGPFDASDASPPWPDPLPPPEPFIVADAAPAPTPVGDVCDQAFAHLRAIACTPHAPKTGSWQDVCRNARAHAGFNLKPINASKTVSEARKAGVTCE